MNVTFVAASVAVAVLIVSLPVYAEVYKWTDEDGRVQFSDVKPKDKATSAVRVRIETASTRPASNASHVDVNSEVTSEDVPGCDKNDSFEYGGKTFCCNELCVKERIGQGMEVNCLDPRCHEAVIRIRDADRQKKKTPTDNGKKAALDVIARRKAESDKRVIEECNRAREVYCDKGVDEIRRQDLKRAAEQAAARDWARGNPTYPRYTGNDIHIVR